MLARGEGIANPLSSVRAYLDWRQLKIPPFAGGTRSWPANFLEEFRLIDETLRETAGDVDDLVDDA